MFNFTFIALFPKMATVGTTKYPTSNSIQVSLKTIRKQKSIPKKSKKEGVSF